MSYKKYQHDCTKCHFLGAEKDSGVEYDLYFCFQNGIMPTVIARFDDEGSQYMSGIYGSVDVLREHKKNNNNSNLSTVEILENHIKNNPNENPILHKATIKALENGFLTDELKVVESTKKDRKVKLG